MSQQKFINDNPQFAPIIHDVLSGVIYVMCKTTDSKNWMFFAGNGGSHSDALHIVGELCKSFERKRGNDFIKDDKYYDYLNSGGKELTKFRLEFGIKAMTLGANSALSSAIINDIGGDDVFAQELYALGSEGDLVFLISTSGNSVNLVNTAWVAKHKNIKIISLTGPNDSKLSKLSDICIQAPGNTTREIQENHIKIWHHLCAEIEAYKFPNTPIK